MTDSHQSPDSIEEQEFPTSSSTPVSLQEYLDRLREIEDERRRILRKIARHYIDPTPENIPLLLDLHLM